MHPELWVNCLSAAVCAINACHTRGLKNNPVANSISQNNCLRSVLLGCVATKITLSTDGDGVSMCMYVCMYVLILYFQHEAHSLSSFVLWSLIMALCPGMMSSRSPYSIFFYPVTLGRSELLSYPALLSCLKEQSFEESWRAGWPYCGAGLIPWCAR